MQIIIPITNPPIITGFIGVAGLGAPCGTACGTATINIYNYLFLIFNQNNHLPCAARSVLKGKIESIWTLGLKKLAVRIIILICDTILRHDDIIHYVGRIEGRETAAISHTNALRHLRLHYILFSTDTHSSNLAPRMVSKVSGTVTVFT